MATIGKVAAVFSASTSGLKAGVSEASSQFRKLGTDVEKLRSNMGVLAAIQGAALFGQIASAASSAARSFVDMARGQAEAIDQTSKLSRRLGMTYGELSGLKLAGDLASVGVETITKAATKADVAFVKASQGSKLAQKAFAGVGLSVDQLQSKSPAERFQQIAAAIQRLPTQADRAAAVLQVFGGNADAAFQQAAAGSGVAVAALRSVGLEVDTLQAKSPAERFAAMAAGIAKLPTAAGRATATLQLFGTEADEVFAKAQAGSFTAGKSLEKLGLSTEQLAGRNSSERFAAIADAISALPTAAERATAAVAIFGKSGAELLPLFEGGGASIRQAADEAQRFGLALTNKQGLAVENMNDAFTRAFGAIQGVTQQVVAYLAPAVQGVADTFSNLVGTVGGANIGQMIGEGILAGAEWLATVADSMIAGLTAVWEYVSGVADYWQTVWDRGDQIGSFLSGVANVFKIVFSSFLAGITWPITNLLKGAAQLMQWAGIDTSIIDGIVAGADKLNNGLFETMDAAGKQAGEDFKAAWEGRKPEPPQTKGPVANFVADAVAKARENIKMAPGGEVTLPKPPAIPEAAPNKPTTQAVSAVDSRSAEGLAEMFRLMRGTGDDVQEQQLEVLEEISEKLNGGDVETIVAMAGA